MSTLLPFLVVNESRDQVKAWVKKKLAGTDFRLRLLAKRVRAKT